MTRSVQQLRDAVGIVRAASGKVTASTLAMVTGISQREAAAIMVTLDILDSEMAPAGAPASDGDSTGTPAPSLVATGGRRGTPSSAEAPAPEGLLHDQGQAERAAQPFTTPAAPIVPPRTRRRPEPVVRSEPPPQLGASPWRRCQWIEGDARDRRFCGAPTVPDLAGRRSSWCAEHYRRAHAQPRP